MKISNMLKQKKGFSTVELLGALIIMAILVAMGMSYVSDYSKRAEQARIKADLDLLAQTSAKYIADLGKTGYNTLNGKKLSEVCTTLKTQVTETNTNEKVGPWLATCPQPPHADGVYTFKAIAGNSYVMDVQYSSSSAGVTLTYSALK